MPEESLLILYLEVEMRQVRASLRRVCIVGKRTCIVDGQLHVPLVNPPIDVLPLDTHPLQRKSGHLFVELGRHFWLFGGQKNTASSSCHHPFYETGDCRGTVIAAVRASTSASRDRLCAERG